MPSNENQRISLGYNLYHCYNLGFLYDTDSYLGFDAQYGIESAAIMWGGQSYQRMPPKQHPAFLCMACMPEQVMLTMRFSEQGVASLVFPSDWHGHTCADDTTTATHPRAHFALSVCSAHPAH